MTVKPGLPVGDPGTQVPGETVSKVDKNKALSEKLGGKRTFGNIAKNANTPLPTTPSPETPVASTTEPVKTPSTVKEEEYDFQKTYDSINPKFMTELTGRYAKYAENHFETISKEKYGHIQSLIDAAGSDPKAMKALEKMAKDKDTFSVISEMINDEDEFSYYKDFARPTWQETQDPALREVKRIEREMQARQENMTATQKKADDERVVAEKQTQHVNRRVSELTALQSETGDALRFDSKDPNFTSTPGARLAAGLIEYADFLETKTGQRYSLKDAYDTLQEFNGVGSQAAPTSRRTEEGAPNAAPTSATDPKSLKAEKLEALKNKHTFRELAQSASKR